MEVKTAASNGATVFAGGKRFFRKLKEQKYLYMMVIPGIIWMLIFNYIPMYGIIIAFKDYNPDFVCQKITFIFLV